MNVQYRTFGHAGWQVSEIAPAAGDWGAVDETESVKTLHHAYERGINFVDTAELYGCRHSEEVIGEPLRQSTQDRPSIKTGGPVFADGRDWSTRGSS